MRNVCVRHSTVSKQTTRWDQCARNNLSITHEHRPQMSDKLLLVINCSEPRSFTHSGYPRKHELTSNMLSQGMLISPPIKHFLPTVHCD